MKTFHLVLFLIGSLSWGYAQTEFPTSYNITYEVTYSLDTLDLAHQRTEDMFLFAGAEYGVFLNKAWTEAEEKLAEIQKKYGANVQVKIGKNNSKSPDLNKAIFTDLQSGTTQVILDLKEEEYFYTLENLNFDWEIRGEPEEFMGYSVQQATTHYAGRDYVAWFTTEIPIPDGPYVFHGLPGLIVELYDTEKHYHFKMKGLERLEEEKIWELPKAKKITRSKLAKLRKKLDANAIGTSDFHYMIGVTSGITGTVMETDGKRTGEFKDKEGRDLSVEDFKRQYKKALESRNNPIELD